MYKIPGLGVFVDDRQPSLSGEGVCVCPSSQFTHTRKGTSFFYGSHYVGSKQIQERFNNIRFRS